MPSSVQNVASLFTPVTPAAAGPSGSSSSSIALLPPTQPSTPERDAAADRGGFRRALDDAKSRDPKDDPRQVENDTSSDKRPDRSDRPGKARGEDHKKTVDKRLRHAGAKADDPANGADAAGAVGESVEQGGHTADASPEASGPPPDDAGVEHTEEGTEKREPHAATDATPRGSVPAPRTVVPAAAQPARRAAPSPQTGEAQADALDPSAKGNPAARAAAQPGRPPTVGTTPGGKPAAIQPDEGDVDGTDPAADNDSTAAGDPAANPAGFLGEQMPALALGQPAAVAAGGTAGAKGSGPTDPGQVGRASDAISDRFPATANAAGAMADPAAVWDELLDPANGADTASAEKSGAKEAAGRPQQTPFGAALDAAGKAPTPGTSQGAGPAGAAAAGKGDPTTAPDAPPEARFAQANHARIVTGVRGELLPNGGTMHLRLDPPELGDLQISMHLRDGVMTAAFHTSNDEATRLLSHSLGELKSMLEAQGVSVERLHVQQSPKNANPDESRDSRDSRQGGRQEGLAQQRHSDQREQQRKQLVQKMWDKLAGNDPVDMVA